MYHTKCHGSVYIKKRELRLANFTISDSGIKAGVFEVMQKADNRISFYCVKCKKDISLDDVYVPCSHCGSKILLINAIKVTGVGGLYCQAHANLFPGRRFNRVSDLIKTMEKEND